MNHTSTFSSNDAANIMYEEAPASYIDHLLNQYEDFLQRHRVENPDLYRLVELQKKQATNDDIFRKKVKTTTADEKSLWTEELRGAPLRDKIRASHRKIRQHILTVNATINL